METQTEIFFNKRKVLLYTSGALLFVLAGAFFLIAAMGLQSKVVLKFFLFTLSLISILFFGLIAIVLLQKLFTSKAGLVIADEGIWDHSSGVSAGFVPWSDIKKINFTYSGSNTFIVLMLKKPEKFLSKQRNPIKKLAMHINHKISGSPVHIQVNLLNIDLYQLNDLITAKRYSTATDVEQL